MYPVKILLALLILFCLHAPRIAVPQEKSNTGQKIVRVDSILADVISDRKVPGMSAAVMRDGHIVAIGAAGVRKANTKIEMTSSDKLHLGSCSKAITATMIGVLIDKGQLQWNDTIGGKLPKLRDEIPEKYLDVSIWQLLTHRAGVISNGPQWLNKGVGTRENRLAIVAAGLKNDSKSGQVGRYEYSNFGYVVAAAIAEQVTGKSWETLVRTLVFEPLDMTSAGFGPPSVDGANDQPWGHLLNPSGKLFASQFDNPPSSGPAGTIHCSIGDWAKFVSLHLDTECRNHKILSPETLVRLHTPPEGNGGSYAGGWLVEKNDDGSYQLAHEGSNTLWLSTVLANPQRGTAELVVSNVGINAGSPANRRAIDRLKKWIVDKK